MPAGTCQRERSGFKLLPRLKNIGSTRLYSPGDASAAWPQLNRVIKNRPIDWDPSAAARWRASSRAAAAAAGW